MSMRKLAHHLLLCIGLLSSSYLLLLSRPILDLNDFKPSPSTAPSPPPTPTPEPDPYLLQPPRRFVEMKRPLNNPLIDEETGLLFCWIPKNGCSQFKELFCKKQAKISWDTIPTMKRRSGIVHGSCIKMVRIYNSSTDEEIMRNDSYLKLAVVRDPLERFVSGFWEKCNQNATIIGAKEKWCYGCGLNVSCFLERNYKALRKLSEGRISKRAWPVMNHFHPQFWECGFKSYEKEYQLLEFSRSPALGETIKTLFTERGWPQKFFEEGWPNNGTFWQMSNSAFTKGLQAKPAIVNEIVSSQKNLVFFFLTFKIDYLHFRQHLPIPEVLLPACNFDPDFCPGRIANGETLNANFETRV